MGLRTPSKYLLIVSTATWTTAGLLVHGWAYWSSSSRLTWRWPPLSG